MTAPFLLIPFLFTFVITVSTEHILIPLLKKTAKQPIYESGPKWHMSKQGTPTMGGIAFCLAVVVVSAVFVTSLFIKEKSTSGLTIALCLAFALLNCLVGVIDDIAKLRKKENKGLSAVQKLIFQFAISITFILFKTILFPPLHSGIEIFGIDTSYFSLAFELILCVFTVNSANLTDGIDGLAASVAFTASFSLFLICMKDSSELAFVCSSLMGASAGFLIFNINPARIFMGDTGSLFLGALITALVLTIAKPIVLPMICFVYFIEGLSVIIQVLSFKLTGKRVFKMAPLHHHFEKMGLSENTICILAIITTLLASIPAFIILR